MKGAILINDPYYKKSGETNSADKERGEKALSDAINKRKNKDAPVIIIKSVLHDDEDN